MNKRDLQVATQILNGHEALSYPLSVVNSTVQLICLFIIVHVWKLLNNKVPNVMNMELYYNNRLGWKAKLPKLHGR